MVFFVDFDGTITREDTCIAMLRAFAREGWQELNELWERRELTTQECAQRSLGLIAATPAELAGLLESIEIDAYFPEFLRQCRRRNHKVYILSDGYDFNISCIMRKYDINVPYYANKLLYDGSFKIECPYFKENCDLCGTCKSDLMEALAGPGCRTIYIGDGYSDTCPAAKADIVYAKGTLYRFCLKEGIEAIPYEGFQDIIHSLGAGIWADTE